MYNISLNEMDINFKDLEKIIYKLVCEQACQMLVELLEKLDDKLMEERGRYELVFIETQVKIGLVLGINIGDIIELKK